MLFLVAVPGSRFSNIERVAIVGYLFGNATDVFGWILELHLIGVCLEGCVWGSAWQWLPAGSERYTLFIMYDRVDYLIKKLSHRATYSQMKLTISCVCEFLCMRYMFFYSVRISLYSTCEIGLLNQAIHEAIFSFLASSFTYGSRSKPNYWKAQRSIDTDFKQALLSTIDHLMVTS